jgi:hypothetical protein
MQPVRRGDRYDIHQGIGYRGPPVGGSTRKAELSRKRRCLGVGIVTEAFKPGMRAPKDSRHRAPGQGMTFPHEPCADQGNT